MRTLPSDATKPPCAVPVCTLILLMPSSVGAARLQRLQVAAHERVQLVDVGVLAADLADFAADRDGDAVRLVRADERGEVGAQVAVDLLLLVERRLVEIDQRRGVDVDVVEAGRDLLLDERAERVELLVAIRRAYFFAFTWTWSPWKKSGPSKPSRSAAASTLAAYSCGRCSV